MFRAIFPLTIFCLMILLISCSSTNGIVIETSADKGIELNDAIKNASDELVNNIPINTEVVLLNISDVDVELTNYFIEELGVMLDRSKALVVVERKYLEAISIEQNFQLSGYVSDKDMVAIGKYVSAQTVISCNMTGSGELRRLRLRAIDVETAIVQYNNSYEIENVEKYVDNEQKTRISSGKSIETTIISAINKLIESLPYNVSRISLQNITSEYIKEKLTNCLIHEFAVLDRDNVRNLARDALGEGYGGYSLGAEIIITGGEYGSGEFKSIVFRAIKVETSEEIAMVMEFVNDDSPNIISMINNICNDIQKIDCNQYITIEFSFKEGIDLFIENGIESKLIQTKNIIL